MAFGVDIELLGVRKAARNLKRVRFTMRRRILRIAVSKAAGIAKRAAKSASPKRTGLLGRSMKARIITDRTTGGTNAKIGPGKGFKRALRRTRSGRLIASSRLTKQIASGEHSGVSGGAKVRFANPQKYAHLVELGHRPNTAATHFIRNSFEAKRRAMNVAIATKIKSELNKVKP